MSSRSSIRDALLSAKTEFKSEVVPLNGVDVEVRQSTVKSRSELMKRSTVDGAVEFGAFLVWGVIYNTYVPGTNEKVFDEQDYDVLMEDPTGGIVDQLGEAISKIMNVSEDLKEKAKNSTKTLTK